MAHFPEDIKIEALLEYLPEDSFVLRLCGLHKRNACKDLLRSDMSVGGRQIFELAKMGLYDSLPEYIFHTSYRFDKMRGKGLREEFLEEVSRQEKEKEDAIAFFRPVDIPLLHLKKETYLNKVSLTSHNAVLLNMLGDRLTPEQTQNRFIQKTLQFLPQAKDIRGNETLLTILLRKIFKEENLELSPLCEVQLLADETPRYEDSVGGEIGTVYAGNKYEASVICYNLRYWSEEACDDAFPTFIEEMEVYRLFLRDWFLSVEEDLAFRIEDLASAIWLSDTTIKNYLNFNTNLI